MLIALGSLATIFVLIRADLDPRHVLRHGRPRDRDLHLAHRRNRTDRRRAAASSRRAVATPDHRSAHDVEREVHADVEARVRDRRREHEEAGAARGTSAVSIVAPRTRWPYGPEGNEWLCGIVTSGSGSVRPLLADERLDERREPVGGERPANTTRTNGRARRRTTVSASPSASQTSPCVPIFVSHTKTSVERVPAVVDDPPLEVPVPAGQTGAICFVCSISWCRSNGLPTNACAPTASACVALPRRPGR